MSILTSNYKFVKPELSDPANITMLNPNWDAIDAELKRLVESLTTSANNSIPKMTKVTIPSSGWDADTLTQTITVSGILADDTKQLVQPVPSPSSMDVSVEAGVYCSGQSAGALTFKCAEIPSEDIIFNVSYQDATYVD